MKRAWGTEESFSYNNCSLTSVQCVLRETTKTKVHLVLNEKSRTVTSNYYSHCPALCGHLSLLNVLRWLNLRDLN